MITALLLVVTFYAVVVTILAIRYRNEIDSLTGNVRALGQRLGLTQDTAARLIETLHQNTIDLQSENAEAKMALETIRDTIKRRPPRRRWLHICQQVAKQAARALGESGSLSF